MHRSSSLFGTFAPLAILLGDFAGEDSRCSNTLLALLKSTLCFLSEEAAVYFWTRRSKLLST